MTPETADFIGVKMDAEINSCQDDFEREQATASSAGGA